MFGAHCIAVIAGLAAQDVPRGRCVWEHGVPDSIVAWLTSDASDASSAREVETELGRHARKHGWSALPEEPDRVSVDRVARCPDAILDLIARTPRWCDGTGSVWPYAHAATCLLRNGRVDAARNGLDLWLAQPRAAESRAPQARGLDDWPPSSHLAALAAHLAANAGEFELALDYSRDWWPTPSCLGMPLGKFTAPIQFRMQCLIELGRPVDAHSIRDEYNAKLGHGDSIEAEGPVLELFAELVPGIPLEHVVEVMAYWRRCGRTPGEWLATPELLAFAPPIAVRERLRDVSDAEMEVLVSPLLDDAWTEIDRSLAYQLAWTGHRLVGPALDHVVEMRRKERDVKLFETHREEWARNCAWLDELSRP